MPKFHPILDKDLVKILEKSGFVFIRQKGSHKIFKKSGHPLIIVPIHNREIKKGLYN